jgi:hypothetical protein
VRILGLRRSAGRVAWQQRLKAKTSLKYATVLPRRAGEGAAALQRARAHRALVAAFWPMLTVVLGAGGGEGGGR